MEFGLARANRIVGSLQSAKFLAFCLGSDDANLTFISLKTNALLIRLLDLRFNMGVVAQFSIWSFTT